MPQTRTKHSHRFSIADKDAVQVLIEKLQAPNGSREVDGNRLHQALDSASQHYTESSQQIRRAFFHGLLTGYAVGLKVRGDASKT
jgi:hypothetical protein